MITRQIRPLALLEQAIKPLTIEHKGVPWLMVRKGYEPHYQWVKRRRKSFKEDMKVFSYDHEKITIALEMAKAGVKCLTYADSRRYETIAAVPKS